MSEDQLMLNDDKTEFLIIGTRQQLSKVSIQSIKIGQTEVSPVASAHNLGTWFDTHLDMGTHITPFADHLGEKDIHFREV